MSPTDIVYGNGIDTNLQMDELEFQKAVQAFQQQMAQEQFQLQQGMAVGNYNGQNTTQEQSLMGQGLNGQNDLEKQQALGYSNEGSPFLNTDQAFGFDQNGRATLGEQQFQANTALNAMQLLAQYQGNPWVMQKVANGLSSTGVPNVINNLFRPGGQTPGFQGNQATPIPPSLAGLAGMITGSGGSTASGSPAGGFSAGNSLASAVNGSDPTTGAPVGSVHDQLMRGPGGVGTDGSGGPAGQAGVDMTNTVNAMGPSNKMNSPEFASMSPSDQNFVLQGYQALGVDPNQVKFQMQQENPQFSTPRYGDITA